ncbi:MAG: DNA phosphorothioation-associated putative methyltransferase [Acidimicrobiales bacterium]
MARQRRPAADGERDETHHPVPQREEPEHVNALVTTVVLRHRTAMSRSMLSRPMTLAYEDGVVSAASSVFDYGCGRGHDVQHLRGLGISAAGWDPGHSPDAQLSKADVVNIGYVINVIENQDERRDALRRAWSLARQALVVAARPAWEARGVRGRPHGDGVLTAKDTFQRFYEQDELRSYLESTLGQKAIAAAPGIFYVFRDEQAAQTMLARRARRTGADRSARVTDILYELHRVHLDVLADFVEREHRLPGPGEIDRAVETVLADELGSLRVAFSLIRRATGSARWSDVDLGRPTQSERRFDQHRDLLEPLMSFLEDRGRLPTCDELEKSSEVEAAFGSVRSAFAVIRRVTGADRWKLAEHRSRQNFLVYLALAAFGGRPRFSDLPDDLRLDVRDLFGSYKAAISEADQLLFGTGNLAVIDAAVRQAPVGKLTQEALYVHISSLDHLPPQLRVYVGCGEALAGTVDDATIVKLHREKPQVSYLSYPTFDSDPHPALASVIVARLGALKLTYRDFRDSENPPILHRKETFVGPTYPGRDKFARLTRQEEHHDLLSCVTIGTRIGWQEALSASSLEIRGHRVLRRRS